MLHLNILSNYMNCTVKKLLHYRIISIMYAYVNNINIHTVIYFSDYHDPKEILDTFSLIPIL